jgi:hypothetical protein
MEAIKRKVRVCVSVCTLVGVAILVFIEKLRSVHIQLLSVKFQDWVH